MNDQGPEVEHSLELGPGARFADYDIVRPLGEGEFGAVYEAVRSNGQRVALKVLRVAVQGNEEIVARFTREARAVALLKHPSIVAAHDVGEYNGVPYLAMELLRGDLLGALVEREGKLSLTMALDIAIPLMAAVRTVHAQNIVHRDLKPENVFVTYPAEGAVRPKVLDFGFAKMAEPGLQLTGKDTAIGTPNFMSPEQMLSPRGVDPRSDQWALGVLLYYMLTGTKPFEGKNLGETLRNVLQRDPPPLRELRPDVPEAVASAVARAMRKPPDERFATVHDFAQAILKHASDATQLLYASEFYTVAVWEKLGEEPPRSGDPGARPSRSSRRARLAPTGVHVAASSSSRPSLGPLQSTGPAISSARPRASAPTPRSDAPVAQPRSTPPRATASLRPAEPTTLPHGSEEVHDGVFPTAQSQLPYIVLAVSLVLVVVVFVVLARG